MLALFAKAAGFKAQLAIGFAVFTVVSAFFWWQSYQLGKLEKKLEVATKNNAILEQGVNTQSETIDDLQKNMQFNDANNKKLNKSKIKAKEAQRNHIRRYDKARRTIKSESIANPEDAAKRVNDEHDNILDSMFNATNPKNKNNENSD
jgi:hypothetical protein